MKTLLLTLMVTAGVTFTALAVDVTLNLTLTPDEVATLQAARSLSGATNMTAVQWAESVAKDALLEKAAQVDAAQRELIRRNWRLLSLEDKQRLVEAVLEAVTPPLDTNAPPATNSP